MLIFLHMHKCAGSTVVRKAEKSGLQLPAVHHNGNLLEPDGETAVRFHGMDRETLQSVIHEQHQAGTQFFAMEWDFPVVEHFDGDIPITLFTLMRDPFERAVSNFRFAKLCAWIPRGRSFQRFMNDRYTKDGPLARSSNYFTRKLCSLDPVGYMGPEHLDRAMEVLERFQPVIFVGSPTMSQELSQLGLVAQVKPAKDGAALRVRRPDVLDDDLVVSEEDREWFIQHNSLDIALVSNLLEKSNKLENIVASAAYASPVHPKGKS